MKKINIIIGLLAFVFAWSCTPEDFPAIGEAFDKTEGISGTWKLTKVMQVDANSVNGREEVDITSAFSFSDLEMQLASGGGASFNAGTAPMFFTEGTGWAFDDNEFPTELQLTGGSTLTLQNNNFYDNVLKVRFSSSCNGNVVCHYDYTFTKQ